MKILVTTMKNNDDKKIVSTQFLSQETDTVYSANVTKNKKVKELIITNF